MCLYPSRLSSQKRAHDLDEPRRLELPLWNVLENALFSVLHFLLDFFLPLAARSTNIGTRTLDLLAALDQELAQSEQGFLGAAEEKSARNP